MKMNVRIFMVLQCFRNADDLTAVDLIIATLTTKDPPDTDALKERVQQAMMEVVQDGSVGTVVAIAVAPEAYVDIGESQIGKQYLVSPFMSTKRKIHNVRMR